MRARLLMPTWTVVLLLAATLLATPSLAVPTAAASTAARDAAPTRSISAGGEHTCEVRTDGTLWCVGRNTNGQLGLGRQGPGISVPEQVGDATSWASVSAGGAATCALRTTGALYCFGVNHRGQLGDGTRTVRSTPVKVAGRWAQVDIGWFHACGVRRNGRLLCWGDNSSGQLGLGGTQGRLSPTLVEGRGWTSVAVEGWNTCGTRSGKLFCWGRNGFGQLGDGTTTNRSTPARVGDADTWSRVDVAWTHACGLQASGTVSCWGRGDQGQLGRGTWVNGTTPVAVAGELRATSVSVGESYSCLTDTSGARWCWGGNAYRQVAAGGRTPVPSPVQATGGDRLVALTAGWTHACALDDAGVARCWGSAAKGQLALSRDGAGRGTASDARTARRAAPARAQGSPGLRDEPGTFRLATMNVLGDNHTRPYAHDDHFGPTRVRAEWTAQALLNSGMDLVGIQEQKADQLKALTQATGGAYAAYPSPRKGDDGVEAALLWRKSVWEPVQRRTIRTQFIKKELPRPYVRLRHRATGQEVWIMVVHNAPWEYQKRRNEAVREQLAKIQQLERDGIPVFYVGDFNEKQTVLCKVLEQTDMVSPRGGTLRKGRCTPPKGHLRVDWLFGSRSVAWSGYTEAKYPLMRLATDHWVPTAYVGLP